MSAEYTYDNLLFFTNDGMGDTGVPVQGGVFGGPAPTGDAAGNPPVNQQTPVTNQNPPAAAPSSLDFSAVAPVVVPSNSVPPASAPVNDPGLTFSFDEIQFDQSAQPAQTMPSVPAMSVPEVVVSAPVVSQEAVIENVVEENPVEEIHNVDNVEDVEIAEPEVVENVLPVENADSLQVEEEEDRPALESMDDLYDAFDGLYDVLERFYELEKIDEGALLPINGYDFLVKSFSEDVVAISKGDLMFEISIESGHLEIYGNHQLIFSEEHLVKNPEKMGQVAGKIHDLIDMAQSAFEDKQTELEHESINALFEQFLNF